MMKWLVRTIVVMGCACALGCGERDISSEGKILQVVPIRRLENTPPEAIQKVEDAIRAVPSKVPAIDRFEWGRNEAARPSQRRPVSHCLLVLFEDPQSAYAPDFQQALREVECNDEEGGPYVHTYKGGTHTYLVHDATPHVQTSTHGLLRLVVLVSLKPKTTEEMQKFKDAIVALPAKIPAIERLEWGAEAYSKPKTTDPADRSTDYCLLFTFDSSRARDACLSHPAYKDFQDVLKQYVFWDSEMEFVAHVEHIARPD